MSRQKTNHKTYEQLIAELPNPDLRIGDKVFNYIYGIGYVVDLEPYGQPRHVVVHFSRIDHRTNCANCNLTKLTDKEKPHDPTQLLPQTHACASIPLDSACHRHRDNHVHRLRDRNRTGTAT